MKFLIILLLCFAPFNFLEKETENKILYFGASWCPACVKFKRNELPKIRRSRSKVKIEIYDVDIHSEKYKAWKKNTNTIPLFVFVDDDKEYMRITGYQSSETILRFLENSP
jgi:thiol-disulfide isomerase/thioredoxin